MKGVNERENRLFKCLCAILLITIVTWLMPAVSIDIAAMFLGAESALSSRYELANWFNTIVMELGTAATCPILFSFGFTLEK